MHMITRMQEVRICHEPYALPFQNRGRGADEEDGCVGGPEGCCAVLFGDFCRGEGGSGLVAVGVGGGGKGADWGEGFGGVEDEVREGGHAVLLEGRSGRWVCCSGDLVDAHGINFIEAK